MGNYIIAYDLGTGGNKASLYNREGECIKTTFVPYETLYPVAGWHEQRPTDWWDAVVESTHTLLSSPNVSHDDVECLALSGQSLGVVPIDKHGNLLRDTVPIWSDTRTAKQTDEFFSEIDPTEWYMTTGNGFSKECYSVFKIMWYRDNEPGLYSQIFKILGSKDYINFRLTGEARTDYSYASGSGVYNLKKWGYDSRLMEASGLPPTLFPDIVPSTYIIGEIAKDVSEVIGLSNRVKVVCGGVDNSCMALGAGNITEGRLYLSLGSSAWIAVSSHGPIVDVKIKPFVFTHVIPEMFTSATAIFSAGNSLKWVRDTLCKDIKEVAERENRDPYEMMTTTAEESPIGAHKLIFNPSLAGGSAAHLSPQIQGAFLGIDLSHTQADVIRAVMEGIALDLRIMLDKLDELCELSDEVLLVGGGGKSRLWRQIFSNIFNRTIVKTNVGQDAASLGAATVAAIGAGMWKDFSIIDEMLIREDIEKPENDIVAKYEKLLLQFSSFFDYQVQLGNSLSTLDI